MYVMYTLEQHIASLENLATLKSKKDLNLNVEISRGEARIEAGKTELEIKIRARLTNHHTEHLSALFLIPASLSF